ncbi:WD40-repeat-containing domain protein [Suillus placidus]|uniref:WD40-repeat-containing domain protein n=1 Tax=Suillus placidus TaxID=48579 RepID=A0A9P6ZLH1_9AGAM|nr:WD40-repeat-containing domain protein [Suillus placidus]
MSVFARWIKKSTHRYQPLTRLTAPSGSVHALAISNDGQVLACGGTGGVKLWDINSRTELACSSHHHESRGTVSCAGWVSTRPTAAETLCYGTWDLTSSDVNTRIAVGMRDKIVQVLILNANSQLQSVFSVRLDNTTIETSTSLAFTTETSSNWGLKMALSRGSLVANQSFNQKRGLFIIDNATDGFTLYCLENEGGEPIQTFMTAVPSVSVPKQVAFGEEGKVVAGGSDNRSVYIFDRKTGELLYTLHQADGGLVQTIATRDTNGRCTIASASPVLGQGNAMIKLWVYDYVPQKTSKTPSSDPWSLWRVLMVLTQVAILLSMSVLLMVNYKDGFFSEAVGWSVDQVHQYTTPITRAKAADEFTQRAIDEYLNTEGRKEGHPNNDIVMLRELAGKLMELAIEADGDLDEDECQEEAVNNIV